MVMFIWKYETLQPFFQQILEYLPPEAKNRMMKNYG